MLLVKTAVDGKIVLVNGAAEELLGYDRSEIVGKTATVIAVAGTPIPLRQDAKALASGRAVDDEYALTTRKLGIRRCASRIFPLLGEQEAEKC